MTITGLGLLLIPFGRLHAQAAAPALPPATTNQPSQSSSPAQTPAQTGSQNQPGLLPRDEPPSTTETLKIFSREVDLIFTVTDHRGHFVTGLAQQDFGLLDDGRPPSHVVSFKQQTNLPLRVGIMLDTSTSIRQRFQFEQQAATDFLLQVLRPEDRAFVEGFDVQTELTQDFTNRVGLAGHRHSQAAAGRRHGSVRLAVQDVPRSDADAAADQRRAQGDCAGL